MPIGEVCNRDVICIEKHESALKAAQLMREYHVGDVIVTEKHDDKVTPIAILTDRDLVIEVIAAEISSQDVTVKDIMSQYLLTAMEDEDVSDVVQKMQDKGVRRVPVINKQEALVGIFTLDDLIELMAEQLTDVVHLIQKEQYHERQNR